MGRQSPRRSWLSKVIVTAVAPFLLAQPARGADTDNGRRLYATHCDACHGGRGRGGLAGVPDLTRGALLVRSDPDLVASILAGSGAMPGFLGLIREREVYDLVAYLRLMN